MQKQRLITEATLNLLIWLGLFFFIRERIDVHQSFIDQVKNIGNYVDTNFWLWGWHLSLTAYKAAFAYVLIYGLLPRTEQTKSQLLWALALLPLVMGLEYLMAKFLYSRLSDAAGVLHWNYSFFSVLFIFLFVGIASFAYRYSLQWIFYQKEIRELNKTKAAHDRLRMQLNPHFLFNTLNTIYSLAIQKDEEQIANGISRFTETLRYTLETATHSRIPLKKELEYIKNYLALQQQRFEEDELNIRFTIKGNPSGKYIIPMVLINYIENAFKHGISLKKPSYIQIDLNIDEAIVLQVVNSKHATNGKHEGKGNLVTRQLLELMYPNSHTLAEEDRETEYRVNLRLEHA